MIHRIFLGSLLLCITLFAQAKTDVIELDRIVAIVNDYVEAFLQGNYAVVNQ